jgi:hypothetical protein
MAHPDVTSAILGPRTMELLGGLGSRSGEGLRQALRLDKTIPEAHSKRIIGSTCRAPVAERSVCSRLYQRERLMTECRCSSISISMYSVGAQAPHHATAVA